MLKIKSETGSHGKNESRCGSLNQGGEEMAIVVKRLTCLSAWVVMLGLGSLEAAEPSAGWKAGVARVDTTPTTPVRMAGYGSRTSPSQGVAHPLFARALALADARDRKVVMVTCDIIGFRRSFTNHVAGRVKAKYGLPREDLVLFASHNHAGPALAEPTDSAAGSQPARDGFEANVAYTRELEDKIVALAGEALARMEPASLSYGVGRAHFALNRREPTATGIRLGKNPAGPTDESVPILRVQNAGGKALAIVFGYACHNTTLRPDMMKIAADFAGYAQDRIEADNPGSLALFVTGCAGDADPHPFGTLEMAREHGEELGAAVKFVLDHPTWLMTLTGSLRTAFTETAIHFGGPTDRGSYEQRLTDPNRGRAKHAQRMIEAIDQGRPIQADYPHYSAHAFALGDQLTLVALSGEVVVDYAIRLQKELGGEGRTLWVAAYANDVLGYIPSVRVLKEGGYEAGEAFYGSTWPAPLADDIESIVVNAAQEVVQKVRRK
jgi:neutral ceramidase